MSVVDCPDCRAHLVASPDLVGACASVGISHGLDTVDVLRRYMARYHHNGHKADRAKES